MTLDRVLEPEWMDSEEEALEYDAMDHTEVNRAFVDRLVELGARTGRLLDVGSGPAHIALEAAERLPGARVVALDAARWMHRVARRRLSSSPAGARIFPLVADAKRMPFRDGCFDAVFSNTILHHIADPRPVLREIRRVVRPGGIVLLRDLRRPRDRPELERLVALHAADANEKQRALFRDSLHASFTLDEVRALLRECGLGDLRVWENSDRHWTAERAG